MVALVSGSGLGLTNTSRELAGGAGQLGEAGFGRAGEQVTVNTANGNLVIQNRDEFVAGVGDDLGLVRTYNSLGSWDGDNADGWRLGYYRRVSGFSGTQNGADSKIKRTDADGFESTYAYVDGRYVGTDGSGAFDTMTFASGVWTWVDGNTGTKETYVETATGSGVYRLDRVTDVEGHSTRLTYHAASGLIATVASWKSGDAAATSSVTLAYDTGTKRLNEMSTVAAGATRTRVRYEYDASGRLSTVRTDLSPDDASMADGRVYIVNYGYDSAGRVNAIVQTDGTSLAVEYDASGRVGKYTDGLGRTTTLTYDTVARTTTVLDAGGASTVLTYDTAQRLLDVSGAALGGSTFKQTLSWDSTNGNLLSVRNAAGETVTFGYDANGNRTRSTDAAGNVVESAYDAANHEVSQTAYTVPDPDGVASAGVASGALKTQNLYDRTATNRVRFTISPEGRVTQHQYNALGQRTSSTTYTGALYTVKPAPSVEELATWASTLSVTELAAAQKKDYAYDAFGQLMSVKTYATATVSGGVVTYGTPSEQKYLYDAFGRLLQSTDATGNVTSYTYDGIDRVTLTQDGGNRVTLYQYDDAGNRVVMQRPADNSNEVSVYDRAGQLVSKSVGVAPQTVSNRTFLSAGSEDWTGYETPASGLGFATATGASLSTASTTATAYRTIQGNRIHRFDSGTVFGAKVAVPALATGQYFTIGAANASGTRYHRALIRDGQLFAQFTEGGAAKEVLLSASGLIAGKAYQVDVETSDAGSTLYVYSDDRASGFVHRAAATDWGNARAQIAAQTSANRSVQVLNILSVSEARHGSAGNVLFDQRFGLQAGTTGMTGWPASNSLFATGPNGLSVQTKLAGLAGAEQTVYGDAVYGAADVGGMQFRAEITTSAAASGRNLRIGIASTGTGVDARALTARFINGDLYAEYRNATTGAWVQVKLSSATQLVKDGQAYVVEVSALAAGGAQLNVYERGTSAAAAGSFSYTLSQAPWKDQRFIVSAFGDAAAVSAVSTIGRVQEVQLASPAAAVRTAYAYDTRGRLRQVIDALGQRTHMVYDSAGRKVADIDAMGRYTEYLYDGAGRLVQTVVSDLPLSAAQLASLTDAAGNPAEITVDSLRPAVDPDDRVSTRYHDKAGRLIGTQDAVGYVVETVYDGAGRVTATVGRAATAAVTRLSTSAGATVATPPTRPAATADATNDRTTRYFYSADGLLQSTLDADGYLVDVEYDAAGRKTSETRWSAALPTAQRSGVRSAMTPVPRPDDRRTLWFYDGNGRIEGELDAEGYLTTFGYDVAGRLTTTTRYLSTARLTVAAGASDTATHLVRAGLTLAAVIPAVTTNVVTTRSYNGAGELVREARPDGSVTRYVYDGNGRVVSTYVGLEAAPRATRTEYTGAGQVAAEIDGMGNRVTHAYDAAGRRISTTDARNNVTVFFYDATGLMRYRVVKTELGGEVTVYGYNGMGQLSKQPLAYANRLSLADTAPLAGGALTSALTTKFQALADTARDVNIAYAYNKRGELTQESDAQGLRTFHEYTAFGQKSADQVELGSGKVNRTTWKYDRRGNRTTEEVDPNGLKLATTREYDAFGRETGQVDALGNRTTTDYKTNDGVADSGRQVVVADALGKNSRIVYDALGRTVQSYDRLNQKTTYTYDTANRRMTVLTAESVRTVTEYTATGEVVRLYDANNSLTVYTYDDNGRLLTTKDQLDNLVENTYDKNGNLVKVITGLKAVAGAAGTNDGSAIVTEYTYDATNRVLTKTVDPTGAALRTAYEYDGRSQQVKVTDAAGTVTTKTFSTRGYLTQVVVDDVAGGLKLKTVYGNDVTGRVLTVTEGADTASARTTQYVYDDAGRRTQEIVDPAGLKLTTTYTYDKAGQVVLKRDALGHGTRYVYDKGGRIQYEVDTTGAVTQRFYDDEGRLTKSTAYVNRMSENHAVRVWYEYGTNSSIHAPIGRFAAGDRVTASVRVKTDIDVAAAMFLGDAGGPDPYDNQTYDFKYGTRDADGWQTLTLTWTMTHDDDMWVYVYGRDGSTLGDSALYDSLNVSSTNRGTVFTEGFEAAELYGYSPTWTIAATSMPAVRVQTDIALTPGALSDAQIRAAVATLDNANDQITQFAYDKDGRQVFSLDAKGGLTQTKYTPTGLVAETIRYFTTFTGTLTATTVPVKDTARDQVTSTVYDVIGRPRFVVDAGDYVRELRYNRQGVATTTVAYAGKIVRPATLNGTTLTSALKPEADNDRYTYQAYDAAGRMRFVQDAGGYMTEYVYDGLGQTTQTLRYDNPNTFSTLPPTLAQFQQVTRTTAAFASGLDGYTGTAGVWDAGRLKLVSQATTAGNWATASGPRAMLPGGAVKFDITPQSFQADLHTGIEAKSGAAGRVVFLWHSNGGVSAQFTGEDGTLQVGAGLGTYVAGTTYTVEILTDAGGAASMYLYAKGQPRESGIVYRVPAEMKWASFQPTFYTSTAAGVTSTTTALVDNVEERAASITSTRYDAAGRVAASIAADGTVTRYAYDALGRQTDVVRAAGRSEETTTHRVFDKAGNVLEETTAYGTPVASTTLYRYDSNGRLLAKTDPRGTAAAFGLTGSARIAALDPYTTRYAYDALGQLTATIDPLGFVTLIDYDVFGNAVRTTDVARGYVTTTHYDKLNRAVQLIDAERYLKVNAYDTFGNLIQTRSYTAQVVRPQDGRVAIVAANGTPPTSGAYVIDDAMTTKVTDITYTKRNERDTTTDAERFVESSLYTAFGEVQSSSNRNGGVATFKFDRLGRMVEESLPVSVVIDGVPIGVRNSYIYDARGNRTRTIEAVGLPEQRTTHFVFDAIGREVRKVSESVKVFDDSMTAPVDRAPTERLRYDALGRVIEKVDANGARTLSYYDANGRKTHELTQVQAGLGRLQQWTFDPAGNATRVKAYESPVPLPAFAGSTPPTPPVAPTPPVKATDTWVRETAYEYDALGHQTAVITRGVEWFDPVSLTRSEGELRQSSTFDAAGNVVREIDARGNATYTYYDGIGRRIAQVDRAQYVTRWVYGANTVTETRYAQPHNAVPTLSTDPSTIVPQSSASDRITTTTLDRLGRTRVKTILNVDYGGLASASAGTYDVARGDARTLFTYDGLGNVLEQTDADGLITSFEYDKLGRQTWVRSGFYTSYDAVAVRQQTENVYSGLGLVAREIKHDRTAGVSGTDRTTLNTYDAAGRLIHQSTPVTVISYRYDANGNRTEERRDVANADGVVKTHVTTLRYNAVGQEVLRRTGYLGDVTETAEIRYNVFGEVTGKRQNGGGADAAASWQEQATYDNAGRVVRSNSSQGVYKLYGYDQNGNAVLTVESTGASLSQVTTAAGASDGTLSQYLSYYDKRDLLVDYIQPDVATFNVTSLLTSSGVTATGGDRNSMTVSIPPSTSLPVIPVVLKGAISSSFVASGTVLSATINGTVVGIITEARDAIQGAGYVQSPGYTAGYYALDLTTVFVPLPDLGWYGSGSFEVVYRINGMAFSGITAGGAAMIQVNSRITSGTYSIEVFKAVGGGQRELVASGGGTHDFGTFRIATGGTAGGAPAPQLSRLNVSVNTPSRKTLNITDQPAGTQSVGVQLRERTTGAVHSLVAGLKSVGGQAIPEWFSVDVAAVPNGTYDLTVVAYNASNIVLNSRTGSLTVAAGSMSASLNGAAGAAAPSSVNAFLSGDINSTSTVSVSKVGLLPGSSFTYKVYGRNVFRSGYVGGSYEEYADDTIYVKSIELDLPPLSGLQGEAGSLSYRLELFDANGVLRGTADTTQEVGLWKAGLATQALPDTGNYVLRLSRIVGAKTFKVAESALSISAYTSPAPPDRGWNTSGYDLPVVESDKNFTGALSASGLSPQVLISLPTAPGPMISFGYRVKGSDGAYIFNNLKPYLTAPGVSGRLSVPNRAVFDPLSYNLDAGQTYEFLVLARSNGVIVDRQLGSFRYDYSSGITDLTPILAGKYGYGFFEYLPGSDSRTLNLINQGVIDASGNSTVTKVKLSYRRANTTEAFSTPLEREVDFVKFDMQLFPAGDLEFIVEGVDANGATVTRALGRMTNSVNPKIHSYLPFDLADSRVTLRGLPPEVTNVQLTYRITKAGDVAYLREGIANLTSGSGLIWDASSFTNEDPTAAFTVEYAVRASASGLVVATGVGGKFQLGVGAGSITDAKLDRYPSTLDFNPGVAQASTMKLYYRVKPTYSRAQTATDYQLGRSTVPFIQAPALLSRRVDGHFIFDAGALQPETGSIEYEFIYELRDAAGAFVDTRTGSFRLGDGVADGGGEVRQTYDLRLDPEMVIHRKRTYNAFGEIQTERDGLDNETTYAYNTLGLTVRKQDPGTSITHENGFVETNAFTATSYLYSRAGRLVSSTDANGNATRYQYIPGTDATGKSLIASEHYAEAASDRAYGYDEFGDLRTMRNEMDLVTRMDYDNGGRLVKLTRPGRMASTVSGATIPSAGTPLEKYTYDSFDRRISTTNAMKVVTRTDYDAMNRVTGTRTDDGTKVSYSYTYDASVLGVGGVRVGGYRKVTTLYGTSAVAQRTQQENIDVFGHNTYLRDYDNREFFYRYNHAGLLTSQSSLDQEVAAGMKASGQNITYTYLANGYVSSITDQTLKVKTSYGYDRQGNRTTETNEVVVPDGASRIFFQAATAKYDALGRVTNFYDARANISYEYDAVGNVRRIHADYAATLEDDRKVQDNWYRYDSMNRFIVTQGELVGTKASSKADTSARIVGGEKGVELQYYLDGQRRSATYGNSSSASYQGAQTTAHVEWYTYTTDGYLETVQLQVGSGPKTLVEERVNDLAGRVTLSRQRQVDGSSSSTRSTLYYGDNRVKSVHSTNTSNDKTTEGDVLYYYNDDATLRLTHQTSGPDGREVTDTAYTYQWWSDARQASIRATDSHAQESGSTFSFDANGHTAGVTVKDGGGQRRFEYTNNAEGQILTRNEYVDGNLTRWRRYFYLSGRRMGDVSNDGPSREDYAQALARSAPNANPDAANRKFSPIYSADFDQNYEPISPTYPGAASGSYTVQKGDTLQRVAMAVWGDSAMWYLLADANGLSGSEILIEGQTLVVPNKVTNIHHNAQTQRVYNAGEAMGKVDPVLPAPPPPGKGCGAIGMVIMVVIAVIVSIYTAGAAAGAMGAAISSSGAVTVGAGTLSATIGVTATGAIAGAVGAAAGSVASQLASMTMGMQDSFSWKQVGTAALGGAVTGGLANASALSVESMSAFKITSSVAQAGVRGAVGAALTQGLQGKWNWRGVFAAGFGAAAGAQAGKSFDNSDFGRAVGGRNGASEGALDALKGGFYSALVSNMSGTIVSQMVGTGKADPKSAWINSIGNAIASSIGDKYNLRELGNEAFGLGSEGKSGDDGVPIDAAVPFTSSLPSSSEGSLGTSDNQISSNYDAQMRRMKRSLDDEAAKPRIISSKTISASRALEQTTPEIAPTDSSIFKVEISGVGWRWGVDDYNSALVDVGGKLGFDVRPTRLNANILGLLPLGSSLSDYTHAPASNEPMSYSESVSKAFGFIGDLIGAGVTVFAAGSYNGVVKAVGGASSVGWLAKEGVDAAVGVQESIKERWGWTPKGEGVDMLARAFSPFSQSFGEFSDTGRAIASRYLGDGVATILGASIEAGSEILGLAAGGRGIQAFLDRNVFVFPPLASRPQLYGVAVIPDATGLVPIRIETVTNEMRQRFQGMGYLDPIENIIKAPPAAATMAVDHIYPVKRMIGLPGFNTLTKQQMTSLIQDTVELGNLQPLTKSLNSSKGSSLNWTKIGSQQLNASYVSNLSRQQRLMEQSIMNKIFEYQNINRGQ